MAWQEACTQQIDAALKAARPAAGARIGKGLVAVVDALPEEARPVGASDASAFAGVRQRHQAVLGHQDLAAAVRQQQRVADALV